MCIRDRCGDSGNIPQKPSPRKSQMKKLILVGGAEPWIEKLASRIRLVDGVEEVLVNDYSDLSEGFVLFCAHQDGSFKPELAAFTKLDGCTTESCGMVSVLEGGGAEDSELKDFVRIGLNSLVSGMVKHGDFENCGHVYFLPNSDLTKELDKLRRTSPSKIGFKIPAGGLVKKYDLLFDRELEELEE